MQIANTIVRTERDRNQKKKVWLGKVWFKNNRKRRFPLSIL